MAPPPPRASGPPSPQAGRTVLVRTAGCRVPSTHGEAAPRASGSPLGPRSGAALRPSSRTHGDSRVLPSRHGAGWPTALGSGLSLALQRRGGGGSTPGGDHPALPARCFRVAHPPRPVTPGLGHRPLCLFPEEGWKGRSSSWKGSGAASGCWSRGGSRAAVAGRGRARPMPVPGSVPPGPAPAAGQTSRSQACCLGPRPPHVPPARPPARTETGVGDFTEGIYCSELSCSQLFDGGTRGGARPFP